MRSTVVRVLVAAAACAVCAARESRTVLTAQGPVRGYKTGDIFEFYGIPYATAPTGPNRFKAPLPGPVWTQPREAISKQIICPQVHQPSFDTLSMQEDCLIANVYMPDTEETNLPVMVYVHGGAYQMGSGEGITTHSLVRSKKIVAVTFNYRLGVHGFLCLGTEGAPGNAGMKDQVALLRWVQKNIAYFGGNPKDVTLVGSSAGSSAVDLLMLSEMTEGLYNKVIPESGASVGVWSVQIDPLQTAKDFALSNNFTNPENIDALEKYYKTAPYDVLMRDAFINRKDSIFVFVPCVERDVGEEMFLKEAPVDILKQGKYRKVPVLYGFANMEGLFRINELVTWKDEMNQRFADFLPADLQFESEEERVNVAATIKKFYFGDKPIGEETVLEFTDYFSDVMFIYPTLRSTQLQVAAGSDSIYLYIYTFGEPILPEDQMPAYMKDIRGANHCAQSIAVHEMYGGKNVSETFRKLKETMQEMWLNFIITGKPVPPGSALPAWHPAGAGRAPHMELGARVQLRGPLLERRARFWDDIYERHYRAPAPPTLTTKH